MDDFVPPTSVWELSKHHCALEKCCHVERHIETTLNRLATTYKSSVPIHILYIYGQPKGR